MHHKGNPGVNVCSSNYTNFDWVCLLCQILEVKSPSKQSKQDKNKNLDCDKVHQPSLFSSVKQPV